MKDIQLKIGDKTYLLQTNYEAVELVEDLAGLAYGRVFNNDTMKHRKILLFGALRLHHPDIAFADMNALMDKADFSDVYSALVQDLEHNIGKKKDAQPTATEPAKKKTKEVPTTTKTDA